MLGIEWSAVRINTLEREFTLVRSITLGSFLDLVVVCHAQRTQVGQGVATTVTPADDVVDDGGWTSAAWHGAGEVITAQGQRTQGTPFR